MDREVVRAGGVACPVPVPVLSLPRELLDTLCKIIQWWWCGGGMVLCLPALFLPPPPKCHAMLQVAGKKVCVPSQREASPPPPQRVGKVKGKSFLLHH